MVQIVKPRRQYDSRRRREQAAQTRRDIEAAADKLFRERGYIGTSMPAIAAEAGVVVETIYRAFGSKAGLFKAVIESALAGGSRRAETPPADRPAIGLSSKRSIRVGSSSSMQPPSPGSMADRVRCTECSSLPQTVIRSCGTYWTESRHGVSMVWEGWLRSSRKAAPCVQIYRSRTHGTSSGHCVLRPSTIYWFSNGAGLRRYLPTMACGRFAA